MHLFGKAENRALDVKLIYNKLKPCPICFRTQTSSMNEWMELLEWTERTSSNSYKTNKQTRLNEVQRRCDNLSMVKTD